MTCKVESQHEFMFHGAHLLERQGHGYLIITTADGCHADQVGRQRDPTGNCSTPNDHGKPPLTVHSDAWGTVPLAEKAASAKALEQQYLNSNELGEERGGSQA